MPDTNYRYGCRLDRTSLTDARFVNASLLRMQSIDPEPRWITSSKPSASAIVNEMMIHASHMGRSAALRG